MCEETKALNTCCLARKLPLPFPLQYLVECGLSAVNDLALSKINRQDITKRGGLRLKLTTFLPRIKYLCSRHQAQGSH